MGPGLPRIHFEYPDGSCPCGKRWRADPRFPSEPVFDSTHEVERVTCWPCYRAAMDMRREAQHWGTQGDAS